MSLEEKQALLQRFADALNQNEFSALGELLTREFFDYAPYPGEPTAPEAFVEIGQALRGAFPDLQVSLSDLAEDGDRLRGRIAARGIHTGDLWGLPGTGNEAAFEAAFTARFRDGKMALRWDDVDLIGALRKIGLAPTPERAHLKPTHPVRLPEIILRLLFNGLRLTEKPCPHLDLIQVTEPSTDVCPQCVASGDEWPALRMCLVCGFVGCCDLSVNKHVKRHAEETGHPIVRSIQPGEGWLWCYADTAFLSSRHLRR